jgi:hypothetical protein
VTLFFTNSGKSNCRLTSSSVLFRKLDEHTLQNFLVASLKSGIQDTVSVNNNTTKLLIIFEERFEWLSLERGLTAVSEHINWLKRLQVKRNFLLLLSVSHFDHTTKNN